MDTKLKRLANALYVTDQPMDNTVNTAALAQVRTRNSGTHKKESLLTQGSRPYITTSISSRDVTDLVAVAVNNSHLFEERRFSRFTGAKEQDFHHPLQLSLLRFQTTVNQIRLNLRYGWYTKVKPQSFFNRKK